MEKESVVDFNKVKPILKWVGGKRQVMSSLVDLMPKNINNYFEPFFGGGAFFIELQNRKLIKGDVVINDYIEDLYNLYKAVKEDPDKLIKEIENFKNTKNNPEGFLYVRNLERDKESYKNLSIYVKAARLVFLNKTCFNGLYRVSKKENFFNTPYDKDKQFENVSFYKRDHILGLSSHFKNATILNDDFEVVKSMIKKGDFVYLDPPYFPKNKTSNFTSYTKDGFNNNDQIRLKEFADYTNEIGAYFMISNSYTTETLDLYDGYNIHEIVAKRNVNSDSKKRGNVKEVIITNY